MSRAADAGLFWIYSSPAIASHPTRMCCLCRFVGTTRSPIIVQRRASIASHFMLHSLLQDLTSLVAPAITHWCDYLHPTTFITDTVFQHSSPHLHHLVIRPWFWHQYHTDVSWEHLIVKADYYLTPPTWKACLIISRSQRKDVDICEIRSPTYPRISISEMHPFVSQENFLTLSNLVTDTLHELLRSLRYRYYGNSLGSSPQYSLYNSAIVQLPRQRF